jgi:hypothetical protein
MAIHTVFQTKPGLFTQLNSQFAQKKGNTFRCLSNLGQSDVGRFLRHLEFQRFYGHPQPAMAGEEVSDVQAEPQRAHPTEDERLLRLIRASFDDHVCHLDIRKVPTGSAWIRRSSSRRSGRACTSTCLPRWTLNPITVAIGLQASLKLSRHCDGETIVPPLLKQYPKHMLNQKIMQEVQADAKASDLTRKYASELSEERIS